MATDPVCGMAVEEGPHALRLSRDNRTYFFCCADCLRTFQAPEETRRRLLRRLELAWPLAVAVVALTWVVRTPVAEVLAAALAGVVQFYAGSGFYRGAWDALRSRVGNMDLLIAAGTSAAFVYSLGVLAFPARLPAGTYFDASALIVTVILTGTYLEQLTRRRAGSALRRLAEMLPSTALVLDGTGRRVTSTNELVSGARVLVPPAERFPVDGVVLDGVSSVDESILTGESTTARRARGDRVLAGSLNVDGPLTVEATSTGSDTFVAHVAGLLEEAELARVPLQARADRIASRFVPFVLAVALVAGTGWFFVAHDDLPVGVLVFVTVAVTACPCAFGLATPAALLVGTGRAAEEGILFRGGDSVERAASVDTVLFDKTGTLTVSEPEVAEVFALPPLTEAEALGIAAGLESGIRHPLAVAVGRAATERGVPPSPVRETMLEPGTGVDGRLDGHPVGLVRGDASADGPALPAPLAAWCAAASARGDGWSIVLRDDQPLGAIAFRSALAPDARRAVSALAAAGYRTAIVTGDRDAVARAVADRLGIEEVHAGVTPSGKVDLVRRLQREGRRVALVGDGVNDAPALETADLGIALGSGSEVARETGQVLLVRSELAGVPRALAFAQRIVRRVRGNLLWSVGYNSVLIPIAAGALVPWVGLRAYAVLPVLGAAAMGLSSTTVLLNSLSLRWASDPPVGRPRGNGTSRSLSRGSDPQAIL